MDNKVKKRAVIVGMVITILMVALVGKTARIQLLENKYLTDRSINQRIFQVKVDEQIISGGHILDRNMIPFTSPDVIKKLYVFPQAVREMDHIVEILSTLTGMEYEDVVSTLSGADTYKEFIITNENLVLERKIIEGRVKGIMLEHITERYSSRSIARHVIGYYMPDFEGLSGGIEKQYNELLHAHSPSRIINGVKDANNRLILGLGYNITESVSHNNGNYDIRLTLDYHLQKGIEDMMDGLGYDGAVVVMDVDTGEILAMVSRPDFDQNSVQLMNYDQLKNKCIDAFELGSVFKIIVAAAVLEQEAVELRDAFYCSGYKYIDGKRVSCHDEHGLISFEDGFAHSCNVAFIEAAQRVGGHKIIEMAERMGLGAKTGVDLLYEAEGNLTPKEEYAGAGIGNLAMGQGSIEATPLQIARVVSIIARGGMNITPILTTSIIDSEGNERPLNDNNQSDGSYEEIIFPDIAMKLKVMMTKTTLYGSGRQAYSIMAGGTAGKTGTPQVPPDGYHSWFAGFYPVDNPEFAVVVFVKDRSSGGRTAAPLAREIIEYMYLLSR